MAGMHEMGKIIKTLLEMPDSADFREPVDWRGLGLDDYPRVIAKPMDLGTVKQKIERKPGAGGYRNVNACVADIRLIWSNCKRYNGEGSDFYDLADRLSKRFEELFAKAKAEAKKRDRDAAAAVEDAWRAAQAKKMRKSINDVAACVEIKLTARSS